MVRLKTRYLLVEITAARKLAIKKEDITSSIRESIAKSYGDFGSGLSQYTFQVLYYNTQTRLAVIRCARDVCKMVETSLVFVTDIQNQDISIRVARVCERAQALNLYVSQPQFDQELQAEIALVDPQ